MRFLVVVTSCALAVGCNKSSKVSQDEFVAATDEAARLEQQFVTDYPRAEAELLKLRDADPAAAARLIDTKILPLFPPVTTAIAKAYQLGLEFVDGELRDDTMRAHAHHLLAKLDLNRRGFERVRDAYAEQSKKLAKGPLSDTDTDALIEALEQGSKMMTQ